MGVSDFVLNFIAIRKGISATLGTRAITLQGVSGELVLKEKMGVASVLLILHLQNFTCSFALKQDWRPFITTG